jgi:hypothetical protein
MNDKNAAASTAIPELETDPVPPVVAEAVAVVVEEAPRPPRKGVVIVGNHRLPDDKRMSIVVEKRTVEGEGEGVKVVLKKIGYPAGADFYYRTDPEVEFPKDSKVITLGEDVRQGAFAGFTLNKEFVNVGPASPVFGAANYLYQQGATEIEIVGLTDAEKERLRPYFDGLPTDPVSPAQVTVTLA